MVDKRTILISGGPIHILDGTTPAQEAMVVTGGRVAAIGSLDEMKSVAGPGADRFDLDGASAMPGIVDSHPHFLHLGAAEAGCVNILDARNFDEIVERIRAQAAITPKGQWILTSPIGEPHYFIRRWYTDLAEGRMPDRHVLDRATTDHPVLIQACARGLLLRGAAAHGQCCGSPRWCRLHVDRQRHALRRLQGGRRRRDRLRGPRHAGQRHNAQGPHRGDPPEGRAADESR